VNGNVKLGRAAARSGEWAQHFSNASCVQEVLAKLWGYSIIEFRFGFIVNPDSDLLAN